MIKGQVDPLAGYLSLGVGKLADTSRPFGENIPRPFKNGFARIPRAGSVLDLFGPEGFGAAFVNVLRDEVARNV